MMLSFELSMPRVNTWNGKWSGEDRRWVRCVHIGSSKKAEARGSALVGSYSYSFGDGWVARIDVKIVDAGEVAKLRKLSAGFCGYEWMIESIKQKGKIEI